MKPPKIRRGSKLVKFLFMLCGLPIAFLILLGLITSVIRAPRESERPMTNRQRLVEQVAQEREVRRSQPAPTPAAPREPTQYEIKEAVLKELRIDDWSWERGGFNTVLLAKFTVANDSMYDVKDLKVRVRTVSPSGTPIDKNDQVIYQVVDAQSRAELPQMNMGFINSQAASASAQIVDCTVIAKRYSKSKAERAAERAEIDRDLAAFYAKQEAEARAQAKRAMDIRVVKYQLEQAEKGLPSFQYEVGKRYLRGDGVEKDEAKARAWFEKSAAQGESLAVKALAELTK